MTLHRSSRVNQSLLSRLPRDDWDFDKINISHTWKVLSLIVSVPVIIVVSSKTIGLETEEF